MTPNEFFASLRALHPVLTDLDILQASRGYTSLKPSERFKSVALSGAAYSEVFSTGLAERDYSFLLSDFSYFQFQYQDVRDRYSVRYGFYPNPFATLSFDEFCIEYFGERATDELLEDYIQFLTEQRAHIRVPTVRYDVDFGAYRELIHPAAHIHFGSHEDNRWAVSVELTPRAFALHIAKMFYPEKWSECGWDEERGVNVFDLALCDSKKQCRALGPEHFSERERAQLAFG